MPWWEYELMLQHINKTSKEENEKNESNDAMSKYSPDKMMRNTQQYARNMGGKFNMPSMPSVPSMPKLGL